MVAIRVDYRAAGTRAWIAGGTSTDVRLIGGGGGGGGGSTLFGGGAGGGAAYAGSTIATTVGASINVVIAAGGGGGSGIATGGNPGAAGSDSTFNATDVIAKGGGAGGGATTTVGGAGGAGGTAAASTGTTKFSGAAGTAGSASVGGVGGGAAGSTANGSGGTGGAGDPAGGNSATAPGGGGTGGAIAAGNGVAGAQGVAVLIYTSGTNSSVTATSPKTVLQVGLPRLASVAATAIRTKLAISLTRSATVTATAFKFWFIAWMKSASATPTAIFERALTLRRAFAASVTAAKKCSAFLETRLFPVGGGPADFSPNNGLKSIAGTIKDCDGVPVVGALVRLVRESDDFQCATATTNSSGVYTFPRGSADPNTYRLFAYSSSLVGGVSMTGVLPG